LLAANCKNKFGSWSGDMKLVVAPAASYHHHPGQNMRLGVLDVN